MNKEKPKLLFRNLWFIHQLYKVTLTRPANILEVAGAEQTERLFLADFPEQRLLAPCDFLKGAPESGMKAAWELCEARVSTCPPSALHE